MLSIAKVGTILAQMPRVLGETNSKVLVFNWSTAYSWFWKIFLKGSVVLCHRLGHRGSRPSSFSWGSTWSQTSVRAQPPLSG